MSTNGFSSPFEVTEDEALDEINFELESPYRLPDDVPPGGDWLVQIRQMTESVTRIGGEVCRLRAEVDGLLEQNAALVQSFEKLKDVIAEKGHLDMDDFELACEVLGAQGGSEADEVKAARLRKLAH